MSLSLLLSFIISNTHAAFKDNPFDSMSIKPIPQLLRLLIKTFFVSYGPFPLNILKLSFLQFL